MTVNRLKPPERSDGVMMLSRLFLAQYQTRLVTLFGGDPGLSDGAQLDQVLLEAKAAAGADQHGDPFRVAATYAVGLARRPFLAGNLQLATVALATTLRLNGSLLEAPANELIEIMRRVENGHCDVAELASWARGHSVHDPEWDSRPERHVSGDSGDPEPIG